jgi:hypothetical protein
VRQLVPLLDDEDPATAEAARRALVALLGLEPGARAPADVDPEAYAGSAAERDAWLAAISARR